MGVGAEKRLRAVKWNLVGNMVLTWVLTFPGCGIFGADDDDCRVDGPIANGGDGIRDLDGCEGSATLEGICRDGIGPAKLIVSAASYGTR